MTNDSTTNGTRAIARTDEPQTVALTTSRAIHPEQRELLKRTIAKGASDDEFDLFVAYCNAKGLDPISRQVYCIMRFDKKLGRDVMTIVVGIDGFRLQAERTGKWNGVLGPFWCGPDGVWRDVWLDPKAFPVAARVGVLRAGWTETRWGTALFDEFAPKYPDGNFSNPIWGKMPANQIAKCAEAAGLRAAFPQECGGMNIPEELERADLATDITPVSSDAPALASTTTAKIEATIRKQDDAAREMARSPGDPRNSGAPESPHTAGDPAQMGPENATGRASSDGSPPTVKEAQKTIKPLVVALEGVVGKAKSDELLAGPRGRFKTATCGADRAGVIEEIKSILERAEAVQAERNEKPSAGVASGGAQSQTPATGELFE